MREKLKIPFPVIVEGKYDRLRVLSVADCQVLCTEGFRVFRKNETLAVMRVLAKETPVILLTDSDGAGKLIRSYVTRAIPQDRLIQLYIPQIPGKEARKEKSSAEGLLGVEGMDGDLIYQLLAPYSDPDAVKKREENPLSKTDFYLDGLTGKPDSTVRRDTLAAQFGLPSGMTPNALLAALRTILTYEEYLRAVGRES